MSEKTLLYIILLAVGANIYISYKTAMGLQEAGDKVKGIISNPLGILGL